MIITPRRITPSKVEKKEEPVIKKAPKIEPIKKVETVKKAPRKLIEEEEEKFNFSFDDEESK